MDKIVDRNAKAELRSRRDLIKTRKDFVEFLNRILERKNLQVPLLMKIAPVREFRDAWKGYKAEILAQKNKLKARRRKFGDKMMVKSEKEKTLDALYNALVSAGI